MTNKSTLGPTAMDRIPATPLLSLQPRPRPCRAALGLRVGQADGSRGRRTGSREGDVRAQHGAGMGPGPTASAAPGTGGNERLPERGRVPVHTIAFTLTHLHTQPDTEPRAAAVTPSPSHLLCDHVSHKISSLLLILETVTQAGGGLSLFIL